MASCAWARLIRESAYKVPVVGSALNTDHLVLELLDDDPLDIESQPQNEQLYSWLACGDADRAIGELVNIAGTLRTLVYPAQVPLLFGWAFQPVVVGVDDDPDLPWTISEPPGQFASMALDFAYRDDAGTERVWRYLGGKVTSATLAADRNTRGGAFTLELGVTFSERVATSAMAPAAADYPNGAPYFLSATSGGVEINSVAISDYESLSIEASYETTARFDEAATVRRIRHHRRDMTLNLTSLLKFNPDWQALKDNRSTFPAEVVLSYPGGPGQQEVLFEFPKARVADDGWQKQLPIASDRTQQLSIMAEFDRTEETVFAMEIGTQS